MSSTYSFTTTRNNAFINRIADEMDSASNFAIISSVDKKDGARSLELLIRRTAAQKVADINPNTPIADNTFGTLAMLSKESEFNNHGTNDVSEYPFLIGTFTGAYENVDKQLETFRHQLRHAANLLEGKTVKVTVESF